jgi:hypothetical protein
MPARLSYTRAVKLILIFLTMMIGAAAPLQAQPARTISLVVEARTEGLATRDATATQLLDAVRRGLEAAGDIQIVPHDHARRTVWIVTGRTAGVVAASVIVTEQYDRETLMVLGIEDDDMAGRMMALQIVNDHQIFTGRDLAALAKRIVAALDEGVLSKLRPTAPKN